MTSLISAPQDVIGNGTEFQRCKRGVVDLPAMANDQQLLNRLDIYRGSQAQVQHTPPASTSRKAGKS
ncbi:hypothetical protein J7432_15480 [Xanthomonas axonopodis pv. begoniae]|uniref:hypothetical protein n=1 Tax=Xanthomonas phaseoli TaxID=1985254 RepID=UPI0011B03D75|nr:hypothetical protein [Xanthomonas phaseoli]MBO9740367.1 hypothetical protein [Xanthomonas axonopodis pv. begoniae]MBO9772302.1 hypothetical protein [Xanthomonas axonopodis pv. begoniae]MCC8470202.1 hypothetical protein [Xanthomonas phaseoli]